MQCDQSSPRGGCPRVKDAPLGVHRNKLGLVGQEKFWLQKENGGQQLLKWLFGGAIATKPPTQLVFVCHTPFVCVPTNFLCPCPVALEGGEGGHPRVRLRGCPRHRGRSRHPLLPRRAGLPRRAPPAGGPVPVTTRDSGDHACPCATTRDQHLSAHDSGS